MIATLSSPASVAVACVEAVQETAAPDEEVASAVAGSSAQVIAGLVVSATVTLNVQVELLPASSVAVAVTSVVPIANVEPEAAL